MHFNRLSIFWRLVTAFSAVVVLIFALGFVAFRQVDAVSGLTERLLRHPMTVSNATLEIKALTISIAHDMKQLVIRPDREVAANLMEEIAQKDRQFEQKLAVVRDRYLGDPKEVDSVERSYIRWRAYRDESLRVLRAGDREQYVARTLSGGSMHALATEREADRIVEFARNKAQQFNAETQRTRDETLKLLILIVAASTAAVLGVAALVTRSLTRQVDDLRAVMARLSEGKTDIDVPYRDERNEIGAMARAVEVFKENARRVEQRHWVKNSAATMSFEFQSVDDPRRLGDVAVAGLAGLLGAGHGAFYLFDEKAGMLQLAAGYALAKGASADAGVPLGQGVIGQCARERKTILLTPVPQGFLEIASGIGAATPLTLFAAPLVSKDRLVGAIEFALFREFGERERELLDELLPLLALNIDNLQRARETQRLLDESQMKSEELAASQEELQAQQDELAKRHHELQDRNQELVASDEELRSQQEELRELNDRLQDKSRQLEATMAELNDRAAMLDRASRYKSEFLANMSHELRTPLNSLLILARDLADNGPGNLTGDQVESARVILEGGQNLLRLINDILDLSKVEAGKLEVRSDTVLLDHVVSYLAKTFGHMADEKGLTFKIEMAPDTPRRFLSDAGRVDQILTNLIGNALKFTERGSIAVRIAPVAPADRPCDCATGDQGVVAFEVTDSGIGIPADKLDVIFGAFEQIDARPTRKYGGTGLGLAISQKLAHLLGGCIIAKSESGRGSTFTLYLPVRVVAESAVRIVAPARASLPDDRDAIAPGEHAILVVEDDLTFAAIVGSLVRRKGFRLLHAADGGEGLELARRFLPHGIVLDEMLPSLTGHEILSHLRESPETGNIPVHFISALSVVEGLGEQGVLGCLTKPVSREQIEQVIDRLERAGIKQHCRLLVVAGPGEAEDIAGFFRPRMKEVTVTLDVDSALARLATGEVDLLILDPALPGEDGVTLLERAPKLPPVVAYSSAELLPEQLLRLREFTDSIVIKTEHSIEHLADEVVAFLHRVSHGDDGADAPRDEAVRFEGRTILVVDDDMRNLFALSKVLRGRGFRVLMAKSGQRALEQAESAQDIDAVLMDIMMPEMDGYETIRRMRLIPAYRTVPIVAVTALAMDSDRRKCLEAGASDYLPKPVDQARLFHLLRELLPA